MTRAKLLTLTVAALVSANLFAAAVTQNLKLQVTENSNVTVQQYFSLVYAFSANGADGLDASDMGNQNSLPANPGNDVYPFSLSSNGDIITSVDARPDLNGYKRIQLGFYSKFPATIKILASTYGNTPGDSTNRPTYAWIEQISTGAVYYFMGDTVKIDIPANLNFTSDFYLHTGLAIDIQKTDEGCFGAADGNIAVHNPGNTNWTLDLYKNSTLVFTGPVFQTDTTIANLGAGTYTVVTSINSIPVDSSIVTLYSDAQIVPDFAIDNNTPTTDDIVNFTDYTAAQVSPLTYYWTFGDGFDDNQTSTSHQYAAAGVYEVVLTLTNIHGCQAMTFDSVYVSAGTPPMNVAPHFNQLLFSNVDVDNNADASVEQVDPTLSRSNAGIEIHATDAQRIMITQTESQLMSITIMNVSGQIISTTETAAANIALEVPATGIYIVRAINAKKEVQTRTIVVAN